MTELETKIKGLLQKSKNVQTIKSQYYSFNNQFKTARGRDENLRNDIKVRYNNAGCNRRDKEAQSGEKATRGA